MTALIEIIEKNSFNLIYFKTKKVILAIKKRKESN